MADQFTQDFRTQRRNYDDGLTRIGEIGRLWYESETKTIRISDGVTPGGIVVAGGGSGAGGGLAPGDNVSLLTNDALYVSEGDNLSVFNNDLGFVTSTANVSTFTNDALYVSEGDNLSVFNNDLGLITLTDLSAAGDLAYNSTTGEFSVTTYKSTDFDTDFNAKTTDDLNEGIVNLYFSDSRVDARVADTSISSLLDVNNDLVVNLDEDSILIYNATSNEFVGESFIAVLERLKAELEVQYDRLVDEDGSFTYIGEAEPGTDRTQALWRIKRIEEFADGDIDILWANGTAAFDKIWNERALYTY